MTRPLPVAVVLLFAPLLVALTRGDAMATEKPNVLFIAIDDQNDWIGCLGGHPLAKTPNIDQLAERGTVFTNAHCQAPLCNPSRTSLMTSRRPSSTGIYGLAPWFRNVDELKDIVSLPQYLREYGYKTYSAGKIYHGGYGRKSKDDEFDVLGPPVKIVRPKKKFVKTPQNHALMDWGKFPPTDEETGEWQTASWAVEQLESDLPEPFFLSFGHFLPHVPCYAPPKWHDLYPDDDSVRPEILFNDRSDTPRSSWFIHWELPEPRLKFLLDENEWTNLCRSYLACVSFVDSQIGRVLTALNESGRADNTIIVLWSDHGYHLGEKEISGKNTLWDDSTRVPLIFAGPGVTSGQTCVEPAELLDIYPTLVDLCGLPPNGNLEGVSLSPQLQDASVPTGRPAITTHNQGNHGIRTKDWRYIRYVDGAEELYDMQADPKEWTNLADNSEYESVLTKMRAHLPEKDVRPAPGSRHRVLIYEDGVPNWQGEDISADDPIPQF
ncbi:sulfatase [Stratiformator vulcanicus]|uniref:Choline-sulfatase n=1 Tax=Stratiformator vulcanicus TaxID=2527980 RepID=A0A517R579_9PLAN|nr:sulfatase [Stratiformator vulcanicus]QDT38999.1 Choline-sulfatase [Stratiformator vulcanicus]